jgi:hypothetical protein
VAVIAKSGVGPVPRVSLPVGWVEVFKPAWRGADFGEHYHGPVIAESDLFLRVEVWGSAMTFTKTGVHVVRALEVTND